MITRIRALQAHPVPSHVYHAGDIFDPAIRNRLIRAEDVADTENPDLDMGNVTLVRCSHCETVMREDDAPEHDCG